MHGNGRHYRDYIVLPISRQWRRNGITPRFLTNFSYRPLLAKQPSPGVTGNIGEALGGILGVDMFGLKPRRSCISCPLEEELRHQTLFSTLTQCRCCAIVSSSKSCIVANSRQRRRLVAGGSEGPKAWPSDRSIQRSVRANDRVLVGAHRSRASLDDVGYGMIIIAEYQKVVPTLTVHFLVPREPPKVQRWFRMLRTAHPTRKKISQYVRSLSIKKDRCG